MQSDKKRAVLNRPVFTQTSFSSAALTVLTTWIHHFREAGLYQVRVSHAYRPERSFVVDVSAKATTLQQNVDLTALAEGPARGCCAGDDAFALAVDGVMAFYPTTGTGGFTVRISKVGEREEKEEPADNAKGLPAGDLFAVTLVRPGTYEVSDESTKQRIRVVVAIPKGERVRSAQPRLLYFGEEGFEGKSIDLQLGQSLVVLCQAAARLHVKLIDDATAKGATTKGAKVAKEGRGSLRVRRSPETPG